MRWRTTIIAVLLMVILCGCSTEREDDTMNNNGLISKITSIFERLTAPDDSQLAQAQLETILTAIKEEDSDTILKMFSTSALKEIGDLQSIEALFSFPASNITSWDELGGNSSAEANYGILKKKYVYGYKLHSEDAEYVLWITTHTRDDEEPDNEGLYSIKIYEVGCEVPKYYDPGVCIAISQ